MVIQTRELAPGYIVPADARVLDGDLVQEARAMYDTILVSLDGSLAAEAVLWEVEKLLSIHPAKVIVLLVVSATDFRKAVAKRCAHRVDTDETFGEDAALLMRTSEAGRAYLRAIAERLEKSGGETIAVVGFRNPVEEIVSQACQWKANLIAMATHGRSGLDRMFHSSVTESVLHRVSCPMLIVRVPQKPLVRFASAGLSTTPASKKAPGNV
jgi:nucleotide-binding universal stress UspA family protein